MSSVKNKMEALKAAFNKKTTVGNQDWKLFFKFWQMPTDSTVVVRFLPDADPDNSLGFLVENLQHELIVNGQKKRIPCLAMYNEHCPICDVSRKYYAENNDEMGKKYYRKKSYIGQVIVIDSPIEHDQSQLVKLIDFGPAIFTQIQSGFKSGDLEEPPYELKGGYNFRIKKTTSGQYASYSTSSFAPKQTDLDDELIQQLKLYNLADYRGEKIDVATVEAYLLSDQTGQTIQNADSDTTTWPPAAPAPAPTPEEGAKHQARPSSESSPAPAVSSKTASVLEQLRARAKAAKLETAE